MPNPFVTLKFKTDNEKVQHFLKLYWEQGAEGDFVRTAAQARSMVAGMEQASILKLMESSCSTLISSIICEQCRLPFVKATSRTDFKNQCGHKQHLCENCIASEMRERERRAEGEYEKWKEQTTAEMAIAFGNAAYETVPLLAFKLLKTLAKTGADMFDAGATFGMSSKRAREVAQQLANAKLIGWGKNGYWILPELKEALERLPGRNPLRSVFGSNQAFRAYKLLRRKHLFVFPEVSVAAFVAGENVEHLFTESWHRHYFLSCRLDFLVCDPEGLPRFGVEYQGSYHQEKKQKERDTFKRLVLEEVGLPVQYLAAKDLKEESK